MFERNSRYYDLDDLNYSAGGRQIVYKERRFLPRDSGRPLLLEVDVAQGDRPDLLAARTLQSAGLFWQLCDGNGVMQPFELTARSGRTVRIYLPGVR